MKRRTIIIITVVTFIMMIGLCACSAPSANSPTATVEKMLQAVKADDTDVLKEVYAGDVEDSLTVTGEGSEFQNTVNEIIQDFDYQCSNEKVDGDTATVDVSITTYNTGEAYLEAIDEFVDQAYAGATDVDAEKLIVEHMSSQKEKDFKKTVSVKLTKIEGKWMVDEFGVNDPFFDAITGGLVSASEQVANSYGSNSGAYSSSSNSSTSGSYNSNKSSGYGYDPSDQYAKKNDLNGDGKLTDEEYNNALSDALDDYVNTHDNEFTQDLKDYGYNGSSNSSTNGYGYDSNDPYAKKNDLDGDGKLTDEEFNNAFDDALDDYVNTHDNEFTQDLKDYGY